MTNNSNKETFEDFFSRKKNGEKREAIWLLLLVVFYVLGIVINKWGGSLSLLTIRFTSNILSVATPGLAFVSFAYGVTFLMEHYKLKKMTPEEKGLEKEIWEYEQKKRKEFNAVEQTMLHDGQTHKTIPVNNQDCFFLIKKKNTLLAKDSIIQYT